MLAVVFFAQSLFAANPEPFVSASVSIKNTSIYVHQTFQLTLVIRSSGVKLDNRVRYSSLFEGTPLKQLGEFREQVTERKMDGSRLIEIKRFICNVRYEKVGHYTLSPVIHIARLKRTGSFFGPGWQR